ncbi:MAG: DUF819 family protein [Planctomycetota bacterium]
MSYPARLLLILVIFFSNLSGFYGSECCANLLLEKPASEMADSANPPEIDDSKSGWLDSIRNFLEQYRFEEPILHNDAAIFGILMVMLGLIFWASQSKSGSYWSVVALVILLFAGMGFANYQRSLGLNETTQVGVTNTGMTTDTVPLAVDDNSEEAADEVSNGAEPDSPVVLDSLIRFVGFYVLPLVIIAVLLSWGSLYRVIPMLLMCYFAPSLLTAFGWVDPEESKLYYVATRYMLPASLVLLTISVDLREIVKLGPKAIVMFLTGTVGVVLGGPIAVLIVSWISPDIVAGATPAEVWKGLSTVAGSWIGGGANQAAMKEIFLPDSENPIDNQRISELYSVMVAVDVLVAEFWMIFLLLGVGKSKQIDRWFNADASAVERLQEKMEEFSVSTARVATTTDLMVILAIGFGVTAVCHIIGDAIAPWIGENFSALKKFSLDSKFFWLIVLATTFGVIMSFTKLRNLEGAGASKIGTVCIFVLVATIGLKMDVFAIFEHPGLFVVGGIWMLFHVLLLFIVGYCIRAPYFFLAVGSKANIGGAASAPVVAAAFHPSLAPVGVLLAVLGYALGTYGAWLCAILMQSVSPAAN